MASAQPNIVIIGGGIGGLFAANALLTHGLHVSVYEQAPQLGEIGAGVYITPNSARQLERVGLGPALETWGARVGASSQYFRDDGTPIAPVQVTDSAGWNATFGMHRADLVQMLAEKLPAGIVRTGHRCTGFEQTRTRRASRSPMAPSLKATLSSPRMAFTPNCGRSFFRRPIPSSPTPSPIVVSLRMNAFRIGRPIRG